MKKCCKCGEVKPAEAFGKCSSNKDGLASRCKPCNKSYHSAYHAANRERINKRRSNYYFENIAKETESKRAYREANIDNIRKKSREHRSANIEKAREIGRATVIRMVSDMSDSYIKQLLTKNNPLRAADIPDWLIEAKREQLKLKRELRK